MWCHVHNLFTSTREGIERGRHLFDVNCEGLKNHSLGTNYHQVFVALHTWTLCTRFCRITKMSVMFSKVMLTNQPWQVLCTWMYASKEAPYVAWISNLYQVLVTFYTWILCTRFKRWMSFATELCWWCNHGKFHIRKNIEHTIAQECKVLLK